MQTINIVRYKRDLRVLDHKPLTIASQQDEPTLALYVREPSITQREDWSWFHTQVVNESLSDLQSALKDLGMSLLVATGEMEEVLTQIQQTYHIKHIYAHEETGLMHTYERDVRLTRWCAEQQIIFVEYPTDGIIRRLTYRDDWGPLFLKRIRDTKPHPLPQTPQDHTTIIDPLADMMYPIDTTRHFPMVQRAGIVASRQRLKEFVLGGYHSYSYHIGRPHESTTSCSRLSVALARGNLSLRQVFHAIAWQRNKLTDKRSQHKKWSDEYRPIAHEISMIDNFLSRIHRHDHFIQKLEQSMDYETRNVHKAYDMIRQDIDHDLIQKRKDGQTGVPLIDAAMRCLKVTWWINFRLRSTVVSFITNTCMQPRQEIAQYLASVFADFEPGIHYPQLQMQAGTTGINQYRIYNPTKQMLEKDDLGKFVDKRVPELKAIPMPQKAEPRKLSDGLFGNPYNVVIGEDYPHPIIDIEQANRDTKKVLRWVRDQPWFRKESQRIYHLHGSRKSTRKK